MRELELAVACDRAGWKYVWSVEHHFLEEYSHLSASEIFLPYVAARTDAHPRRLGDLQHHPAGQSPRPHRRARRHARPPERGALRVRHRARLVEHRVQGLRHPRRRHDARHVRRVAARDPAHVARDPVQLSGHVLLDARAQRAAEAVQQAAPAALGGVRQPVDLREGGAPRARRAVLQPGLAARLRAADQGLQGHHQARRAGRRVRQRQRRLRHRAGLPGGPRAGAPGGAEHGQRLPHQPRLPVPRHLPAPGRRAAVAAADSRADARAARRAHRVRPAHRRRPRRVRRGVQKYADIGCDQIIFGVLASTQPQESALRIGRAVRQARASRASTGTRCTARRACATRRGS